MKKFILMMMVLCVGLTDVLAQKITVKSVTLRQTDLRASTQQRKDANDKVCAIVRVAVVGVKDLQFPDAVGSVDYQLGEYIVYVPVGLKSLRYQNASGTISGAVVFDDWDLEVETKRVYSVVFESENHMRAAIFAVQPATARLTFNGLPVALDGNGMAAVEKPIGEYSYEVSAPGYNSQSGVVKLTEDDISTTTSVMLAQKVYDVSISCTPADATLFIDNNPYGPLNEVTEVKLPDGLHTVRLTAVGYDDYEQTLTIDGRGAQVSVSMQQMEEHVVEHKGERTRTHVNIRNGFYIHLGGEYFDKKQYLGHDWGLKLSFSGIQHFGGVFALREGLAGGVMDLSKKEKEAWFENLADSAISLYLEVPLQVGFSIPFGKFNKNLFSVLGGGYGKAIFTETVDENKDKAYDVHGNSSKTNWDYGLRATLVLDIKHFSIAADASLSLAKFKKTDGTVVQGSGLGKKKDDSSSPNLFLGLTIGAKF